MREADLGGITKQEIQMKIDECGRCNLTPTVEVCVCVCMYVCVCMGMCVWSWPITVSGGVIKHGESLTHPQQPTD